jgi:hypothetical protein
MKEQEIVARLQAQRTLRKGGIEQAWDDIERYVQPMRLGKMFEKLTETEMSQERTREELYDMTAIFGAQTQAAAMHGSITNPVVKWFQFLFTDQELQDDPESAKWLQDATERVYTELYDSNFDPEISSAYQDLVGPGNACLFSEVESDDPTDWQGFNFCAVPLRELYFEQDHRGRLARFYRDLRWTALQIFEKFSKEYDGDIKKFPKTIQEALENTQAADQRFEVVFCVYKRLDKYKNRSKYPLAPTQRAYGCKYVLVETQELLGAEDGYYDMPAYLTRFEKAAGSMWGFGPGNIVAPTAKFINAWMEMELLAIEKGVDPPTLVEERALMSDLELGPGKMTLVRDINRIKHLVAEGRIDWSKMELKELRDMIRQAFKVDELQLKESPQMSATEAQIRYELMNRVLGPTLARIQTDMLDPLLMRMFRTLLHMKQLDPIPKLVLKKKAQYKISYSGPLMRAQKTDEVAAMERFVGTVGGMAKILPTVLNVIDPVKVVREMAERLGVPADILRSDEEVQKLIKGQQQLAAAQAKAQLMQQAGQGQQELAKGKQAQQQGQPQQAAA